MNTKECPACGFSFETSTDEEFCSEPMCAGVTYPQIHVQLTGTDGNAFAVMGEVYRALRREVGAEAASAYSAEAMESESYDALLQHAMRTVYVS